MENLEVRLKRAQGDAVTEFRGKVENYYRDRAYYLKVRNTSAESDMVKAAGELQAAEKLVLTLYNIECNNITNVIDMLEKIREVTEWQEMERMK